MLKVIDPGLQACIQDGGRSRYASSGLGRSGAMNPWAMRVANLIVGNSEGDAVLEFAGNRICLMAEQDLSIAIAAYGASAEINSPDSGCRKQSLWQSIDLKAGEQLEIKSSNWSSRRYLAVKGGFRGEEILGSQSTDTIAHFGGHKGRFLLKGDQLECHKTPTSNQHTTTPATAFTVRPLPLDTTLRAITGPEADLLGSQLTRRFWESRWQISPQSNRMGCRLLGKALTQSGNPGLSLQHADSLKSHAVLPGTVQLPPGGLPVILLADAQTTGGYPRIAKIIEADLWKLAHIPVGQQIKLVPCKIDEAVNALRELQQYLHTIKLALEVK